MKNTNQNIVGFLLLLISLTACKKFIQVPLPIDQITSATVFSNDQTATAAVEGLYYQMVSNGNNLSNSANTIYLGLTSDELKTSLSTGELQQLFTNEIKSTNTSVNNAFWNTGFKIIYQSNLIIEKLTNNPSLTDSTANHLQSEARFVRALCYFNLTNIYGNLPLATTSDYRVNAKLSRIDTSLIYTQIIADLKAGENSLSISNTFDGGPTKLAAHAFLARVYLYKNDWLDAEVESTNVINSGTYHLETNLNNVFLPGSNETIWQLIPFGDNNTNDGATFIPSSSTVVPSYYLTPNLLAAFAPKDNRLMSWTNKNIVNGVDYYYPFKYQKSNTGTKDENYVVFRLAEQFLIRAEARAKLNKLSEAIADVNIIRNRAGLPDISPTSQKDLLTAILHERQTELFCEYGNRWFDLKRTGTINSILGSPGNEKSGWKPTSAIFPIPQSELLNAPLLTQNPGY